MTTLLCTVLRGFAAHHLLVCAHRGLVYALIAGNLGFDPLGLKPADEEAYNAIATKELNNGRLGEMLAVIDAPPPSPWSWALAGLDFLCFLTHPPMCLPTAMIGAAGMIVQELVSGKGIAEFLGLEAPLPAAFDTNPF